MQNFRGPHFKRARDGVNLAKMIEEKDSETVGIIPVFKPPDDEVKWSYTLFGDDTIATAGQENNKIYDLERKDIQISTKEYLEFDLKDLKILVPNTTERKRFKLYYGAGEIIDQDINVTTGFAFDISPKIILIGRETRFQAISNVNITNSVWNFGDGTTITSNDKFSKHKYLKEGEFVVQVSLTDSTGKKSTKSFSINVGNAKTSANLTIADYEKRLKVIKSDIGNLSSWIRTEIEKEINTNKLDTELNRIRQNFNLASDNDDYIAVVDSLIALNIPEKIAISIDGTVIDGPGKVGAALYADYLKGKFLGKDIPLEGITRPSGYIPGHNYSTGRHRVQFL